MPEEKGGKHMETDTNFKILKWDMVNAQVCTTLSNEEAERQLNIEMPSGTEGGWTFNEGLKRVQCKSYPERSHLVFTC